MISALSASLSSDHPPQLRAFDIRRDLMAVADLVELCFADTLDTDGRRYLNQMRRAANNNSFLNWASRAGDNISLPLSGYVWEENRTVVGNLSLIPFRNWGKTTHLIVNVAVHPSYRRKGIARLLTQTALASLRQNKASPPWLQVRDDNPAAVLLYRSLGFEEQHRRTTWHSPVRRSYDPVPGVKLRPADGSDRQPTMTWFEQAMPRELHWHLSFSTMALRTDWLGGLYRLINGIYMRQWAAIQRVDGKPRLGGVLTWQATQSYANALWLSVPQNDNAPAAAATLLGYAVENYAQRRPLSIDHPVGALDDTFRALDFHHHQTLIWMRAGRWETGG